MRGGMSSGREAPEGIYVYVWLSHFVVQQKPTGHCELTIPQFKEKVQIRIYTSPCRRLKGSQREEKSSLPTLREGTPSGLTQTEIISQTHP